MKNIVKKIKRHTDEGLLFKVRSFVLYYLMLIFNFDIYVKFLVKKKTIKPEDQNKKLVGIFSLYRPLFWHGNIFEGQMSRSVKKQGYEPVRILCRGGLDVCDVQFYKSNKICNPMLCKDCVMRNQLFAERNNVEVLFIDDYFDVSSTGNVLNNIDGLSTIEQAISFVYNNIPFGAMSHLSVCRYFLRLTLNETHLFVYKQFLKTAVKLHFAFEKMLSDKVFVNFLVFNGRYATQITLLELLKSNHIPFHTYEFSEQQRMLYVKNGISVLWADVEEKFSKWMQTADSNISEIDVKVDTFIKERKSRYVSNYLDLNNDSFSDRIDVAVFTNIVWDSAAFNRDVVFQSQYDWISALIQWAQNNSAVSLVIRIHPAELNVTYNKTAESMSDYIAANFPNLPTNVTVIAASSRANSYELVQKAKVVLVYTSSIGLESALEGKPVIVAGWSHYALENIVLSPKDHEEYFSFLSALVDGELSFVPDEHLIRLYVYWYYKIYHRLVNTDLYKIPFINFEDSCFLRVPTIKSSTSLEFQDMVSEFIGNSGDD